MNRTTTFFCILNPVSCIVKAVSNRDKNLKSWHKHIIKKCSGRVYSALQKFSALIVVAGRHTAWRLTRNKEVKQA